MEVARLFGVLPVTLLRLPVSEFRKMVRYYERVRAAQTENNDGDTGPRPGDTVVE